MAINLTDFEKIWASTSPLTPYSFSDANYKEGWNFIGSTPPARQMWDSIQKFNDEKAKYIVDNYLALSGGTMTGTLILSDGGTALSDATVGTVVSDEISSSVSVSSNTATEITHITLTEGVWVVTGHTNISSVVATKVYGTGIETSVTYSHANDGSLSLQSSMAGTLAGQSTKILTLNATTDVYLVVWASNACSVNNGVITAVRIK